MDRCRLRVSPHLVVLVTLVLVAATPITGTALASPASQDSTSQLQSHIVPAGADPGSTGAAASTNTSTSASSDDGTIHRTLTLHLTPDKKGEVAATVSFDIPSNVRSLNTSIPADASVTGTDGFRKVADGIYGWDKETDSPSLRFTVPANESGIGERAGLQNGGYSFVDTGSWALVTVPQLSTGWTFVGDPRPTLEKSVRVDGQGTTGDEIAFLGAHQTYERRAHGQKFTFVVPEAASLQTTPNRVLTSLANASGTLRVGERDPAVFAVAAPTSVRWGAAGIEYGGSDFWVKADERVNDARNVWLHEYVHTRQGYKPTPETLWTIEAGADYYAALLTLQQDRISFAEFRRHLERGTREEVASTILADPGTWTTSTAYLKGALVYGNIDRQLRLDSNGTQSMQSVLSRMNSDPNDLTGTEFYQAVGAAGTSETRAYAEQYTKTSDVPEPWSVTEHEAVYSEVPARVGYELMGLRLSGTHRNQTLHENTIVTVGESVIATVRVSNTGGAESTFETAMYVDNNSVATTTGTIGATDEQTRTLAYTFDSPGQYSVSVAGSTRTVVVQPPTSPRIDELLVNASSEGGEWTATITVTITNPSDRPAAGTVPITLDGETIETIDASLGPGESMTRTLTTPISPGSHEVAAANTTATVDIPSRTPSNTPIPVPGFGTIAAGLALVLTGFLYTRIE